jgi:hypothetical protein
MTRRAALLCLPVLAALALAPSARAQTAQQPELPSGWTSKQTQYADRDMVAAANPLAVDAGVTILAQGGSAIDAAIAVQMMLTLVEPQSSGIGGGAFMLHYDVASKALLGLRRPRDSAGSSDARHVHGPDDWQAAVVHERRHRRSLSRHAGRREDAGDGACQARKASMGGALHARYHPR